MWIFSAVSEDMCAYYYTRVYVLASTTSIIQQVGKINTSEKWREGRNTKQIQGIESEPRGGGKLVAFLGDGENISIGRSLPIPIVQSRAGNEQEKNLGRFSISKPRKKDWKGRKERRGWLWRVKLHSHFYFFPSSTSLNPAIKSLITRHYCSSTCWLLPLSSSS